MSNFQQTSQLYGLLKKEWESPNRNLKKCGEFLTKLKILLSEIQLLLPEGELADIKQLLTAPEFHTALENIEPEQLLENDYIKHPVHLEQYLMEGSYNKVWNSRDKVPAPEYLFFIDILMETISEIASCSEKAYDNLPLSDAATLLFYNNNNQHEVSNFATERGWKINPEEKKIYFTTKDDNQVEIPSFNIIRQSLHYARELEKIV
ncbi:18004_t:CDS:2 [Entrophospora sp. SA101]|nr:5997_t:CDS:2 [Entrophospora sp. SA101]CAJ0755856.1 18004_t:CDS:2 [Entrophospora sp. SA101]CAJ0850080.1 14080_t:CDS:2 [Entrophospora sp. SA101]